MSEVNFGDRTLLDETIIFWGSELQFPENHNRRNMPFILAGNGGGLKTGRWIKYQDKNSSDLLVSILNLCGDDRKKFGDPNFCTGSLPGLT